MAEDWRVRITLAEEQHANRVLRALHEREVRNELRDELGGRVAVSSDGANLFLYANTRRAAEAGERTLREVLAEHNLTGEPELARWDAQDERWEDPRDDVPVDPAPPEEHDDVAEWEVRVELDSHGDAEALAERLESEGNTVTRRWRYLLVSANEKNDAEALAKRIQAEAPEGATVHVEPGSGLAWELMPANPFAIFGGLGV